MNPLLDHLNAPQLAAVPLPPVHALILAGAGSGKTRVLTTRIAWLISNRQVAPPGVLAVTFTNKAAKEMQTRLVCATGCCAPTIAMPACRSCSRSSTRPTSNPPSSAC